MASFMFKVATALSLLALSDPFVIAQVPDPVTPNVTICNWAGLRSGLIRDTIYIDGGNLWWQTGTSDGQPVVNNDGGIDGVMFTLNLSYPFDLTRYNQTTSLLQLLPKAPGGIANNLAPNYEDGAMFVNDNELILYGGLDRLTDAYPAPPKDVVQSYEADQYGPERSTWKPGFVNTNLPTGMTRYLSNGAAASVPSENLAYYFSGLRAQDWGVTHNKIQDWDLADTLIEVDMSTMREEKWSNNSLSDKVPPRADAELAWIPVGAKGILVAIGGMIAAEDQEAGGLTDSQISDAKEQAPGFMTSLPVYDIDSQTWYMQNTTGDGPGQLTEFCSVVAPAKDASSFNVHLYGGYDGLNSTSVSSNDVWILSIPSFTWIKAYSGQVGEGRRGHQCERIYPDQMIVIGGVNLNSRLCHPKGPIQVFNLNTLEFQDAYNPQEWSDYSVPNVVTAQIGGNGDGGAIKTTSFSSNKLNDIFDTPYPKNIPTYYPYPLASGPPQNDSMPTPVSSGGGLASWVGPVLGVVLGLILLSIIALVFVLWKRKRSNRGTTSGSTVVSNHRRNGVIGWLDNLGSPSSQSEGKPGGSVTSTDVESHPSAPTPVDGYTEAAGQPVYEAEAKETRGPVELATPYHFQDHSQYPRSIDFARSGGTPTQISEADSGNLSRSTSQGLSRFSPSAAVSPQSPSRAPLHRHGYSDDSAPSIDTVSSPQIRPFSPDEIVNRPTSPMNPTSPTSETTSATPTQQFGSTTRQDPGPAGEMATTTTTGGVSRTASRPSHTRNISSMSSNLHSVSSPESATSPQDGSRSSTTPFGAGPASEKTSNASGLKRQQTAGKKSSFGEILDERDEAKGKAT